LNKKEKYLGISPVIATIIVVAVTIAISIAIAFWLSGIIGATGYGTRPLKLAIYGDMDVKGIAVGSQFKITIKNLGGDPVYIDFIMIDGKYEALILHARNSTNHSKLMEDGKTIMIDPGETVDIYGIVRNVTLDPSTTHEVEIHTALGLEFNRPIKAVYCGIGVGGTSGGSPGPFGRGAFSTGVKRGDGNIAGILKDTVRNRLGDALSNGRIEIYALGNETPLYEWNLPSDVATLAPNEEKELKVYFPIPVKYVDHPLIVKLVYFDSKGRREEFAYYMDPPTPLRIYILYVEGAPGQWINPTTFRNKAMQYLYNPQITVIDTLEKYIDLLENGSDMPGAIIINCYGESLLGPNMTLDKKWYSKWGGRIYSANLSYAPYNNPNDITVVYIPKDWPIWYHYVANKIKDKGFVWVNPIGIFAWYYTTKSRPSYGSPPLPQYNYWDVPYYYYSTDSPPYEPFFQKVHLHVDPSSSNYQIGCGGGSTEDIKDLFYATYAVYNGHKYTKAAVGGRGFKEFIGIDFPDAWGDEHPFLQEYGDADKRSEIEDLEKMFNQTFPEVIHNYHHIPDPYRALNWCSIHKNVAGLVVFWFYTTEGIITHGSGHFNGTDYPYAMVVLRMGNGFFINNGLPIIGNWNTENPSIDPEDFTAMAAIYFAAYTYVKHYILGDI